MPGASASNVPGVLVEEVDGSPSAFARKIVVPNGTASASAGVVTLSLATAPAPSFGGTCNANDTDETVGAGATVFYVPHGPMTPSSSGATLALNVEELVALPFTLTKLMVRPRVTPGAGRTVTVAIAKNGVATGLSLTYAAADVDTDKSDTDAGVSFAAGDRISLMVSSDAGGVSTIRITWGAA